MPTTRKQTQAATAASVAAAAAAKKGGSKRGSTTSSSKSTKAEKTAAAAPAPAAAAKAADEPAAKKAKAAGAEASTTQAEAEPKGAGDGAKALEKGDTVPNLDLAFHDGSTGKSESILKESGLVIFSYPKANTPGCTKQACGFKDSFEDFSKRNYKVFGVSTDKEPAQTSWAKKHGLQYKLICDPDRKVLGTFGFVKGGSTLRSHVVIEKGGKISLIERGVKPADSPVATLAATTA